MSATKMGRNYLLTVLPRQKVVTDSGDQFHFEAGAGETYEFQYPLSLEMSIRRDILASANTGNFRLYNLNKATRSAIYKDIYDVGHYRQVTLQAGYGEQLSLIFSGNIKEAKSFRSEGSVDFITEIEAFDAGFAMANSFSNWNLVPSASEPTITKDMVINKLVSEDLKKYNIGQGIIGSFPGDHPRGLSVSKNTWELLKTETENHCFIDNEKVYCLNDGETYEGQITLVSSETGMLGTPKKSQNRIVVEMLFEPSITVGQEIELQSRTLPNEFNQIYKVLGIEHYGMISGAKGGRCRTILSLDAHKVIEQATGVL